MRCFLRIYDKLNDVTTFRLMRIYPYNRSLLLRKKYSPTAAPRHQKEKRSLAQPIAYDREKTFSIMSDFLSLQKDALIVPDLCIGLVFLRTIG